MYNHKHFWYISILMFYLSACTHDTVYVIKGQLTGIPAGKVTLVSYNETDRSTHVIDSIDFSKSSFVLKGRIDVPQMMSLVVDPGHFTMQVFLENGKIGITADTTGAEHYDYTRYGGEVGAVIKNYTVTGSVSHDDYLSYQNDPGNLKFSKTFSDLNELYTAEKDPEKKEGMRYKFDSVRTLSNEYQKKWILDFVGSKPSSVAGVYLLSQYYQFDSGMPLSELEPLVNTFDGEAKSTTYYSGLTLSIAMRSALLPGNLAPDFTLLQRDSSLFTLSSMRGGYVMIDFWASWCKPCREAIPHWKEIYKTYHDKGFDMVSVSDDSRWGDWIRAMDKEQMPWIQVIDEFPVKNTPARIGTLYQTHFIPFYVLLDKEGRIILYTDSEEAIDLKLKELF